MKCPHCGKEIDDKKIMKESARINGSKVGRKLSSEEASRMSKMRWYKKLMK